MHDGWNVVSRNSARAQRNPSSQLVTTEVMSTLLYIPIHHVLILIYSKHKLN
jgi:hypothetical protein